MRNSLHLIGLLLLRHCGRGWRYVVRSARPFRPLKGKPRQKGKSLPQGLRPQYSGNSFAPGVLSPRVPSGGGHASFFFAVLEKSSEAFLRWSLLLGLVMYVSFLNAQDIHFSQFNFSPLNQNPANTNLFDGDYRFVGNYKNQWPTVPVKYNTVSLSAEMNFVTLKNNDRVGADFYFIMMWRGIRGLLL